MAKTKTKTGVINLKIDAALKNEAARLAGQLGVPLSMVIQGSLRQFIAKRGISFFPYQEADLSALKPSRYLQEAIAEARRERARGDYYSFGSAKEAQDFLGATPARRRKTGKTRSRARI